MPWPSATRLVNTWTDTGADNPSRARDAIDAAITAIRELVAGANRANGPLRLDAAGKAPAANLPRGTAHGVASLDASGKVPAAQLPAAAGLPTGATIPFAGRNAPAGFLLCTGREVSRRTYSALYAVIGNNFGSARSGYFRLPDLRGRVAVGAGRTRAGLGASVGSAGGADSIRLSTSQMPAHSHRLAARAMRDPGGSGSLSTRGLVGANEYVTVVNNRDRFGAYDLAGVSSPAPTLGKSSTEGAGAAVRVVQPSLVLNYVIKT